MKKNIIKSAIVLSFLASSALMIHTSTVNAAELSPEVTAKLGENVAIQSGIVYVDANGQEQTIDIPEDSVVTMNATSTRITVKDGKQTYKLDNVKEITFKNITVSNLIPFYLDSVTKVTLDGVNFQKGVDFSGMKNVQELIVKNSEFGATDYSLAIHSAPQLKTFIVDNSTLNADLRIYSNKSLVESTISNSVLKDDASQYSNQKGYNTNYVNTRIERPKGLRVVSSGGMSPSDIFHMNPNTAIPIAETKFDASKPGYIYYTGADKEIKTVEIPAGVKITSLTDSLDKITVKLSNKQQIVLEGTKDLYFRNADIDTVISFVQKNLRLESLKFVNSRTKLIDVAYSETMKTFELHGTEVSQSTGYVSVYNNKAIENFVMQDSKVTGSSGYISVYNNKAMKNFIMNNDYTYGYLSTYNLGEAVLKLSNSRYDDYISSTNVIEGEAGRQTIGYAPTITASDYVLEKYNDFGDAEALALAKANDVEDGDITSSIKVIENTVDSFTEADYKVVYEVTDSDGNTVQKEITVTVE